MVGRLAEGIDVRIIAIVRAIMWVQDAPSYAHGASCTHMIALTIANHAYNRIDNLVTARTGTVTLNAASASARCKCDDARLDRELNSLKGSRVYNEIGTSAPRNVSVF